MDDDTPPSRSDTNSPRIDLLARPRNVARARDRLGHERTQSVVDTRVYDQHLARAGRARVPARERRGRREERRRVQAAGVEEADANALVEADKVLVEVR
jgi:hypothetical protein